MDEPNRPQQRERHAVIVGPGEGSAFWSVQDLMTLKVRAADTGGQFSLFEMTCLPGGGPPPHRHAREDEMFYVLDGTYTFIHEDATFTAGPGSAVYIPHGATHTFTNRTDRPAKALVWAGSDNFEPFMATFGIPVATSPTPPAPDEALLARLLAACNQFELRMLPEHKPTRTTAAPTRAAGPLAVLGTETTLALVSDTTRGRMCVADIVVPPGGGAPPHSHRVEDELFYVIDGSFEITVAGKTYPLPTGATAYVPRGTAHAFRNVGDADGRLFDMHTPGGFERFFFACDATAASAAPPDEAGMRAFLDKHGMDVPEPVSA